MNKVKLTAAILGLLSISQIANSATITNGSFDSNLDGWTVEGNVTIDSEGYAVLDTEADVDTSAYGEGGFNGSILSQTINALAGDVISFSYNFSTSDYFNDFALVVGDIQHSITDVATVGDFETSGWQTFSFTALSDFADLKFVVSNFQDEEFDSTLFIDDVTVSSGSTLATPVPAAVWLFGSGLVGLLGFNRKRAQSLSA